MTKVTDKLEKLQCDNLVGKTIKDAIGERGYYYLLFEDNTWCHTDYTLDVSDMLELLENQDPIEDPFIEFGLMEYGYLEKHWNEQDADREQRGVEFRRQQYERLKKEFENE